MYAALDTEEKGKKAREIVKSANEEKRRYATSAATFDEVVWNIQREAGRALSLRAGKEFLSVWGMTIFPYDRTTAFEALHCMQQSNLRPRDAIHLATMRLNHIKRLVSEDRDFDSVPEIDRIPISKTKI